MTDTVRLNNEIKKSGLKKGWIAAELGLSSYGFWRKVNNENQFKAGEIKVLCRLLKITSLKKKDKIFFADEVDIMTTIGGGERRFYMQNRNEHREVET